MTWTVFVPLWTICCVLGELIKEARIVMEDRQYKSPVRKLLRFFEKSRDQWKEQARWQGEELRRLRQELEKQKHAAS